MSPEILEHIQCKFPIHIWLIYMTSFLDESSTPTHFEVLYYSEDRQMTHLKAFFFAFSRGCFHYSQIYSKEFLITLQLLLNDKQNDYKDIISDCMAIILWVHKMSLPWLSKWAHWELKFFTTVGATIIQTPRVFPCKLVVQNWVLWQKNTSDHSNSDTVSRFRT